MKVFEFCMFHNEHAALSIKQREAARWVDEMHLCEADRTFRHSPRDLQLGEESKFLKPCVFPASERFEPAYRWGFSRYFPFFRKKKRARQNEAMQRNHVHDRLADVGDDDIVVLSDVDEIIDARHAGEIIDAAKTHGIVSIRMHHTLFYLNLYSENWHEVWEGSPPDYAYRVFVMTGAHFRELDRSSDRLRRLGEWGRLASDMHLMDGFRGFHHSWLGDEEAALEKIHSYSHSFAEHRRDLTDENGRIDKKKLRDLIAAGKSIFPGNKLKHKSFDEIEPLQSVSEMRGELAPLIL